MSDQGAIAPSDIDKFLSGTINSASKKISLPRPSQDGQAPNGLLNENNLGSISSMVKPETGQANREEKTSLFPVSASSVIARPSDNSIAVSKLSASR